MHPPLELTWGLELELVVRYERERYRKCLDWGDGIFWEAHPWVDNDAKLNHLVRADVIRALEKQGIPVHDILSQPTRHERFSKWTVWLDGSIKPDAEPVPTEWAGSSYTGVEIKTPVFLYNEKGSEKPNQKAFEQLHHVISILNEQFSIFVNYTCGLHIHVGNGRSGFPFATVKNMALLATIFERQFNSLHPPQRIKNQFCRPLGQRWHRLDPVEIVADIESFNSTGNLVDELSDVYGNPEKHHAINFCNLISPNGTQTIEFRQHEGTTNPVAVLWWARLCCDLVCYCHEAGEFGVLDFIQDHMYEEHYSITDLLTDLGLSPCADYYEQRGLYDHPKQDWHWRDPLAL
ncbi:MAG: hypothetical protein Q9166_007868 [cf. Caloplaca sp. 2 TL-2023]